MELYEKNGNVLYILNILKKYSDEEHILKIVDIQRKISELYNVEIDTRTIRRNINLLKYKFDYDISTREENKKGYYINNDPYVDFEPGEIRAIIDTFCYSKYIAPKISENIITKCKNMQNVYENKKLENYKVYSSEVKTDNLEVIKNIEDISNAILNSKKIAFEYWKYKMTDKIEKVIVSTPKVSPYTIVYEDQNFYFIGIKEGKNQFYHYRLDRIRNLKVLNEKINIKKTEHQIKSFEESTVELFGGKKEKIEADCAMYLLDVVYERFGNNITILKKDNEYFTLKIEANLTGFKKWVLKNLEGVNVVKPKELKNEILDILDDAKKRYL